MSRKPPIPFLYLCLAEQLQIVVACLWMFSAKLQKASYVVLCGVRCCLLKSESVVGQGTGRTDRPQKKMSSNFSLGLRNKDNIKGKRTVQINK